jgi:hypothetical protein
MDSLYEMSMAGQIVIVNGNFIEWIGEDPEPSPDCAGKNASIRQ